MNRAQFLAITLLGSTGATPAMAAALPLLPMPAHVLVSAGHIDIGNGAVIATPTGDEAAARIAHILVDKVKTDRGLELSLGDGNTAAIRFRRDPALAGAEAYRLTVDTHGVSITARADAGLLYGAMTLAQLLSPDAAIGRPVRLAHVEINDAPRFPWRGAMLDVARHFQPIAAVRATIDQMAAHKLNVLHLHLSDDQGWRVEIKRYPDLTRIGAWRTPPSAGGAPGPKVGGFYTQEELKALVTYAADRGVTIVPEIDLPGHSQATVASYRDVGVLGDRPSVSNEWGVDPYLLNVDDHSIAFIEAVLDEIMDIFPSRFIHLGGDEAVKDQWQRSPQVQAKMASLGIKTENGMQSWLIGTLGRYLSDHGRRLIGWDEILEGGVPPSASVMSWRGEQGAIDAANQGHDVVLAPAPTLYLDSLQSSRGDEPPGRLSIVTLKTLYGYDPIPSKIDPAKAGHVLGAEVTAFSEYLVTPQQVQHAMFPRLAAIAEVTWSKKDGRDWQGFLARLQPQRWRYEREGIAAADSAFAVGFALNGTRGEALRTGKANLTLSTQSGYGRIRYTTNGTTPNRHSPAYAAAITVPIGTRIEAAAFDTDGRPVAAARRYDLTTPALLAWTSSDLTACPRGALGLRVPLTSEATAGPAYNINLFDSCTMLSTAPLDQAQGLTVTIAHLARHYGLAHDAEKLVWHYNVTPHGELVIREKGCDGPVRASFPLPDPATAPDRMSFHTGLPASSDDSGALCMQFTAPLDGPLYAVETVELEKRP